MALAQEHLLSAIVFLPLLSALVVLALPSEVKRKRARIVGLLLLQVGVLGALVVNPGLASYVQQFRAEAELPPSPDVEQEAARAARTLPPLPGQAGAPQADTRELYQLQRTLPWRAGRLGASRAGGTP